MSQSLAQQPRLQQFAVFDIDGTIFRSGLYRELIFDMVQNNELPQEIVEDYRAAYTAWQTRATNEAFNDFIDASVKAFEKYLSSVHSATVELAADRVIRAQGDKVYSYTRRLIETLRQRGYFLIAISGSHTELVSRFADKFHFDHFVGQDFERDARGYYTGKSIKTHSGKEKILERIILDHGLDTTDSVAVGDTSGDVSLLSAVEQPIAFNPDAKLLTTAKQHLWPIVIERKNVIYHLSPNSKGNYQLVEGTYGF
jgi:HAD superfamily hydrolase (TIGR01490 family)